MDYLHQICSTDIALWFTLAIIWFGQAYIIFTNWEDISLELTIGPIIAGNVFIAFGFLFSMWTPLLSVLVLGGITHTIILIKYFFEDENEITVITTLSTYIVLAASMSFVIYHHTSLYETKDLNILRNFKSTSINQSESTSDQTSSVEALNNHDKAFMILKEQNTEITKTLSDF